MSAPTRDELLGLTVPALKERCRQSGRPCSGRKGELVDALLRPAPGAAPRKRPAAGAAAGAAPRKRPAAGAAAGAAAPKKAAPGPGGRDEAARHFAALAAAETGDAAPWALVAAALPPDAGDAAAPIDVDAGAGAPPAAFRWQVDGGDAGWLDFDAASNAAAEARRRGAGSAAFTSPYGPDANLEFMVQINRATGTARPR
ncbi:hypothetical protein JL720_7205 [Aureococcus anophagefferens]|nr:hypothetical protein JL720_7205 [Aureococcus anophagefferens]